VEASLTPERLNRRINALIRRLGALLLARDEHGASFRAQAALAGLVLIWFGAALVEHPAPDPARLAALLESVPAALAPLAKPFFIVLLALFHLHVLRHLLLPVVVLWFGIRAGARYLSDLFELNDLGGAQAYMWSTLFGMFYDVLEIKDGDVTAESKRSTVYKIGGPGYLKIHLGNVALFERVGGTSTICSATQRQFLHGFERLREVVDLRDQIRKRDDMVVYTKDGFAVKATDVQVAFRLWSGRQPRSPENSYPFDNTAMRRVVYGKSVGAGSRAARWTEALAGMAGGEITRYISSRLLRDLIAQKRKVGVAPPERAGDARAESPANTRAPLSLSFYTPEAEARFQKTGVKLIWIGVGTLETPDDVTQEFINAWQTDTTARIKSGEINLQKFQRQAQIKELVDQLTDLSDRWSRLYAKYYPPLKTAFGSGAAAGKEEPGFASGRSWSFLSYEDDMLAADMLSMCAIKLQEELRPHLDPKSLPAKTDDAIVSIKQLSEPKVQGGGDGNKPGAR
jgi:hypothetical protein